jgi:O-antigen/teichoic acid export membrane protein
MANLRTKTLRERVLAASSWNFIGYGLNVAIRLGGNLIMTRLLVPEMFGVMAIATTVQMILFMLSDVGLRQNIVRSVRGDDRAFLDTAWTVQIVRGFVLWLITLALSLALYAANLAGLLPPHSAYAAPVLPLVIAVSSLTSIIVSFQSTKVATAHRTLTQARVIQIEVIGQLTGLIVMIAAGLMTRSIWALVAGGLVSTLTSTTLSHAWMSGHSNRLRWEKAALGELVGFGKWIFISSAVGVFAVNGDRLLLGGLAEVEAFGLYTIAALIVSTVASGLNRIFLTVSLAALSETARTAPSRLREVYYWFRMPADIVLLFLSGLLFSAGQLLIDLLYDRRYAGAGGILEVLSLSLIMVRYELARQNYIALGVPYYGTVISAVRFASLYVSVPLLYRLGGMQAAIWGIALHELATLPFILAFNARFGLNDFRREAVVLAVFPAGYLCGAALHLLRA